MSKIRIKNFGPIKEGFLEEDGWMDIKKVTVFIGNQGSGKSTVAKLISSFMWMEKALNRGDFKIERGIDILHRIYWHNLDDYFQNETEIEFRGDEFCISYWAGKKYVFEVKPTTGSFLERAQYVVPKIVYIPAERNFLSTIKEAFDLSGLPEPLADFSTELRRAQNNLNGSKVQLPVNGVNYEFNRQEGTSYISGDGYRLNLLKASSGFQSFVPMYLVSRYLVNKIQKENIPELADLSPNNRVKRDEEISAIWADTKLPDVTKKIEINHIYAKYHNRCLVNIVEEPEQNLFPTSQKAMLFSLLEFNNMLPGNKLIMTTHSPYLINYLTLAIKGHKVRKQYLEKGKNFDEDIEKIVPINSLVDGKSWIIYELDEENGTITLLKNYKDLPEDDNELNKIVSEINNDYDQLRQIEKR